MCKGDEGDDAYVYTENTATSGTSHTHRHICGGHTASPQKYGIHSDSAMTSWDGTVVVWASYRGGVK